MNINTLTYCSFEKEKEKDICMTRILSSLAATRLKEDKQVWQHGREVYKASHSARIKIRKLTQI